VCYEQMIIDAEVCKTTRRYLRGIDISSRTLALEVISDVGPGGNFLTSLHTARNFREAILISELWRGRGSGNAEGAVEVARGRVEELLSADVEQPLTKDQADQMISIWERVGLDARLARVLLPGGG
jgi:trimethylamine--corrinoid protein Co-methyltransferase